MKICLNAEVFQKLLFLLTLMLVFLPSKLKLEEIITGGPRYSRGLRPKNSPRMPKPRITREHCFGL